MRSCAISRKRWPRVVAVFVVIIAALLFTLHVPRQSVHNRLAELIAESHRIIIVTHRLELAGGVPVPGSPTRSPPTQFDLSSKHGREFLLDGLHPVTGFWTVDTRSFARVGGVHNHFCEVLFQLPDGKSAVVRLSADLTYCRLSENGTSLFGRVHGLSRVHGWREWASGQPRADIKKEDKFRLRTAAGLPENEP